MSVRSAKEINVKFSDSASWKIGDIVNHPKLGPVKIVGGSYLGSYGRVSNFWNYRRVDATGKEIGKIYKGYGWQAKSEPKKAKPKAIEKISKKEARKENSLSSFSDIIDEMAKDREEKHKAQAKNARNALPKWIADLPTATPDALIALYDDALQGGFSNHHLMIVLAEWKDAIRAEMIKRMQPKKKVTG